MAMADRRRPRCEEDFFRALKDVTGPDRVQRAVIDAYAKNSSQKKLTLAIHAVITDEVTPPREPMVATTPTTEQRSRRSKRKSSRQTRMQFASAGPSDVYAEVAGPTMLLVNGVPLDAWPAHKIAGTALRSIRDVAALPNNRLEEIARTHGLRSVWLIHTRLKQLREEDVIAAMDDCIYLKQRLANLSRIANTMAEWFPHLAPIGRKLNSNDPTAIDLAKSRLQDLAGCNSEDLAEVARRTARALANRVFTKSIHVRDKLLLTGNSFWTSAYNSERAVGACRVLCNDKVASSSRTRQCDESVRELKRLQWLLVEDCKQAQWLSGTVPAVESDAEWEQLEALIPEQPDALAIMRGVVAEIRVTQSAVAQAAATATSHIATMILSIETALPSHALCEEFLHAERHYFQCRAELYAALRRAKQELREPSKIVWKAQQTHVSKEIVLLLEVLDRAKELTVAMRLRAATASIMNLSTLSRRAICVLIASELELSTPRQKRQPATS